MSPLYMIKSHGAREEGGREPNKPTGVRHAILLTQTAGTSCSQIKHLNFYWAEQPRKKPQEELSAPSKGGTWKVSAGFWHSRKQAGASPGWGFTFSDSVIAWAGLGCHGSSRTAGHTDTQQEHNPLLLAGNMGWNSEYENSPQFPTQVQVQVLQG